MFSWSGFWGTANLFWSLQRLLGYLFSQLLWSWGCWGGVQAEEIGLGQVRKPQTLLFLLRFNWFSWTNTCWIVTSLLIYFQNTEKSLFWQNLPVFLLLLWRSRFLKVLPLPFWSVFCHFYILSTLYIYHIVHFIYILLPVSDPVSHCLRFSYTFLKDPWNFLVPWLTCFYFQIFTVTSLSCLAAISGAHSLISHINQNPLFFPWILLFLKFLTYTPSFIYVFSWAYLPVCYSDSQIMSSSLPRSLS